jgi:tripeptide aminopeptidase
MDTVSPGKGIQPVFKEDTIFSDGTTILGGDDKAGITSVMEALRVAKEQGIVHGDIEVVFTISEESGLKGSKNLDYSKIKSKHAFILDSGGAPGAIVVKGPVQNKFFVKIIGKAAHAGVCPEKGVSAIQVAASAINGMKLLRIDEDTTANIGVISGGTATNIVCPELEIKAEVRSLKDEKLEKQTASMIDQFRTAAKAYGAQVEIEAEKAYDSFEINEKDEIVEIVRNACNRIGVTPVIISTGGGSDTNILNRNGIKAVTLSKGGDNAHTVDEQIKMKDIFDTVRLVFEIIRSAR